MLNFLYYCLNVLFPVLPVTNSGSRLFSLQLSFTNQGGPHIFSLFSKLNCPEHLIFPYCIFWTSNCLLWTFVDLSTFSEVHWLALDTVCGCGPDHSKAEPEMLVHASCKSCSCLCHLIWCYFVFTICPQLIHIQPTGAYQPNHIDCFSQSICTVYYFY